MSLTDPESLTDSEHRDGKPEQVPNKDVSRKSAKDMSKKSAHDFDPNVVDLEDADETTWKEVFQACCCHSPTDWLGICCQLLVALFFLYFFILGLKLLGTGAQVMTGCAAGALFGDDMNPVSGLMIGIVCTVLLQSSSTTTSIVVTLVGAGAISVNQGIYMVMGSNIGTSVTNTIVAMGQMGDGDQLERAFAGATVHDMFNFLTVAVLFPVEVVTGYLNRLTDAIIPNVDTSKGGSKPTNYLSKIVSPVVNRLIMVNKKVTKSVAQGGTCDEFYPTICDDPENPTKNTCPRIGLIGCPKDGESPCPALFEPGATHNDDLVAGLTAFVLGILLLFICLYGLVTVLQKMLMGGSSRIIYKATDINGWLAMIIGCVLTIAVQSSSITTSTLTPLVGMGLIRLEQMYPMTLGANIGTCLTSLLAALVTEGKDALQVALAHLFFNVTGILLWYPFPFQRYLPLYLARQLGKVTRLWKGFPILYILVMFVAVPMGLLGLSSMFGRSLTLTITGSILVVLIFLTIFGCAFWLRFRGGSQRLGAFLKRRQANINTMETLPYDIVYIQRKIMEIQRQTMCSSDKLESSLESKEEKKPNLDNVAEEMNQVLSRVDALVLHVGLPVEEDTENLGRYWHKETESIAHIDLPSRPWKDHKFGALMIFPGLVASALVMWGLVALFSNGSTGYISMGGLIVTVLGLLALYRLGSYYLGDGKVKSLEAFKDKELIKIYRKNYNFTMGQIKADLERLASHTDLPESDGTATEELSA